MTKIIIKTALVFLILMTLLLISKAANGSMVDPMILMINNQRLLYKLKPYNESIKLNKSAKDKACDMFNKNYWSHYSPDGTTPWDFIMLAGYSYNYAGENLARNYDSDKQTISALMRSERHRMNILSIKYTDIGIGRCGNIVVQHFASPYVRNK